jgi:hypothetical protein
MCKYRFLRLRVSGSRQKGDRCATLGGVAERIQVRPAGWCQVELDDPALEIRVRFTVTATGRVAIAEMVLARFPGVTADALRAIPVGRVEAWANGPGRGQVVAGIEIRSAFDDAKLAEIDGQERASADQRARWGTSPEALAHEEARAAEVAALGATEQLAAGYVAIGVGYDGKPVLLRSRVRNLQLRVPDGQPKPDTFYREVARLYGEVAVNSARPAAVIAEANSVPVSTVHGWTKEARRRGLLAPGERQTRGKR